jgi:hypothetical protein
MRQLMTGRFTWFRTKSYLVLVNGKEKIKVLGVHDTGKGEVGTDMKSIPFSAIEE